jgi:pimeloyl-ACP methyl ester carboxylesterase/DNA-binding CsgD family transcriptional regulator
MTAAPTTCYASGPRGALAYQVTGTGPVDLLMVPGMHSHLELQWQLPGYRRFVRGLSRHCRLIRYDKLGTGLSDPTISTPTVGERVGDLAAVAAACVAAAPVLLGFSEGGPLAIRFAVAHGVSGLVLYGTSVRPPPPEARAELDLVLQGWGSGRSLDTFAPSLAANPEARRVTASLERAAASPAMIRHVIGALADSGAEGLLEHLRIPTLVLHRAREFIPVAEARNLAEHIPGAQLEILPGIDHQPWAGDVDAVVGRVAAFLTRLCDRPRSAGPGAPRVIRPLAGWASLTDAEARVATLAGDGYSNPAIARELFLSRATVETHLKRVYAKLAIDGRHQLHLLRPPAAAPGHSDESAGKALDTRTRGRAAGARTAASRHGHL